MSHTAPSIGLVALLAFTACSSAPPRERPHPRYRGDCRELVPYIAALLRCPEGEVAVVDFVAHLNTGMAMGGCAGEGCGRVVELTCDTDPCRVNGPHDRTRVRGTEAETEAESVPASVSASASE